MRVAVRFARAGQPTNFANPSVPADFASHLFVLRGARVASPAQPSKGSTRTLPRHRGVSASRVPSQRSHLPCQNCGSTQR